MEQSQPRQVSDCFVAALLAKTEGRYVKLIVIASGLREAISLLASTRLLNWAGALRFVGFVFTSSYSASLLYAKGQINFIGRAKNGKAAGQVRENGEHIITTASIGGTDLLPTTAIPLI